MKIIKEIIPYLVIVIAVILIRTFIVTPVRVDGDSMKKTLYNKDILLLWKLGSVNYDDIIVLKEESDEEVIIKRVIAMPNDTVMIKNGKVYVNDKVIKDTHAYGDTSDVDKITLSDGEYFILGDNRLISKDSRYFGPIKEKDIRGKIIFRLFPFNKIGVVD